MYGGGAEVETRSVPRMYVSATQLDHFLNFITSEQIIQKTFIWSKNIEIIIRKENNSTQNDRRVTIPAIMLIGSCKPSVSPLNSCKNLTLKTLLVFIECWLKDTGKHIEKVKQWAET